MEQQILVLKDLERSVNFANKSVCKFCLQKCVKVVHDQTDVLFSLLMVYSSLCVREDLSF